MVQKKKKAAAAPKLRKLPKRDAVASYAPFPQPPRLDPLRGKECLTSFFSVSVLSQDKKLGKKGDMAEFRAQLDSLGLKIVQVTADGNCFFRFRTGFFWLLMCMSLSMRRINHLILNKMSFVFPESNSQELMPFQIFKQERSVKKRFKSF